MDFKPTSEQVRIFKYIKKRPENILIEAYAGAGKTTTVVEAVKLLPEDSNILFLAFNKHIKEELTARLPEHVRCYTSHGLGLSAIKRKYKDSIKMDEFKMDKIIKKKSSRWNLDGDFKDEKEKFRYLNDMKKLTNLCKASLTLDPKWIPYIADRHEIKINESRDPKRIAKLLDTSLQDTKTFDFTDMIFMPAVDKGLWLFPQDYVICDEIQDLNRCQIRLIEKMLKKDKVTKKYTGRLIGVGDSHQCQPSGSKILMSDGTEKNIEDILIGDKVVSYDRHNKGHFVGYYKNHRWGGESMKKNGYNVDKTSKRKYKGNLIVINSGNKISKYTPNHKCLVRINSDTRFNYLLYLMEKNGYYKIGITPLWSKNRIDFNANRVHQENADKFWILAAYENRQDAWLDEQYFSTVFGIPQMIFTFRNQKRTSLSQEIINGFYGRFGKDDLQGNAINLLEKFNRDMQFPFWNKHGKNYVSKHHMFEVRACNLIVDLMQTPHFDEDFTKSKKNKGYTQNVQIPNYTNIDSIKFELIDDYVYSLSIAKHEVYVADGILTHNSIYGFTAADEKSFDWFRKFPNTKILPLSYSFRCAKNIIKHVNEMVPGIKALDSAPEGEVRDGSALEEARDGDFVLCRTTAPLITLFFEFLMAQKKAIIKGADIGLQLIDLIGKFSNLRDLEAHWSTEIIRFRVELTQQGILNPNEHSGYVAMEDKVNTLLFLGRLSLDIPDLIDKIKTIFTDELQGIVLSTIHKAKGLEADRVFIVRPDQIPLPNAKNNWQMIQEKNLEYVAITRAKTELIYDVEWTDEEEE